MRKERWSGHLGADGGDALVFPDRLELGLGVGEALLHEVAGHLQLRIAVHAHRPAAHGLHGREPLARVKAGLTKAFKARQFYEVNKAGVTNVARACSEQENPPVLIIVSSLAAVGPAKRGCFHKESDAPRPVSLYGRSKRAGEEAAERYASKVPTTIVRPPIVFGEQDKAGFEMFKTIAKSGIHPVPGYFPNSYSMIHVGDLVEVLILAADRGKRLPDGNGPTSDAGTGYYFAACDEHPTYYQLGRLIGAALGRRRTLTIPFAVPVVRCVGAFGELTGRLRGQPSVMNWDKAREAAAGSWICSAEKAKQELGFTVPSSLGDRLNQTAQWYRDVGWL